MIRLLGMQSGKAEEFNHWAETVRFVSELLLPIRQVREIEKAAREFLDVIDPKDPEAVALRRHSLAGQLAEAAGVWLCEEEVKAVLAALFHCRVDHGAYACQHPAARSASRARRTASALRAGALL
ncbi:hypothetical protein [Breoghania sp.]|uniref:hypothetical protein n=1 Tax=Breoghania sp. TaxID=2065378 RepID=UPI0026194270|nr:hypothetical protein [Breoghania sp.]MDJ0930565.1 hypothetical protein [Breoghania sp.]